MSRGVDRSVEPKAAGMSPNVTGRYPDRAKGKRVVVELRNGNVCGREAVAAATPPGWAADGRPPARWSLTGDPFDIVGFIVL